MTDQDKPEHRGWETTADYHQHAMDDPDEEMTPELGSLAAFLSVLVVLVIGTIAVHFADEYFTPPPIQLKPIIVMDRFLPSTEGVLIRQAGPGAFQLADGWRFTCLNIDSQSRVVQPNYDNPSCQSQWRDTITKRYQR